MSISLRHLREKYDHGVNIMAYLRETLGVTANTPEIVLQSYDLQAGSYVQGFFTSEDNSPGKIYRREVAEILSRYPAESVMEAGIGEATTLYHTASKFPSTTKLFGFDISWSRVAVARAFLHHQQIANAEVGTGDLFSIPLPESSIDLVYTSHSIEPNGGREKDALRELHRVTRRWLILFEPSSELGSEETKRRIEAHGYCRDLVRHAEELGFVVREHRLVEHPARPDNQTGMIVIEKTAAEGNPSVWACPCCKQPLAHVKSHLYCQECLSIYPLIDAVPCLLPQNRIIATRFTDSAAELLNIVS